MKVLSYNIRDGGKKRLPDIAGIIRGNAPDVIALQEANSRLQVAKLARDLGMHMVFGKANTRHHIAWLSRLPIQRHTNHRLPSLSKTLLEIEVVWNGEPLRLFATHLAGGRDAVHPAQEMPVILDVLRPLAGQPHLLVGDLNALAPDDHVGRPPQDFKLMKDAIDDDPREAMRRILKAGYLDCYRAVHPERPGYTFPADAPWLRFDYILASPEMADRLDQCDIVQCELSARASDHLPVWATFR